MDGATAESAENARSRGTRQGAGTILNRGWTRMVADRVKGCGFIMVWSPIYMHGKVRERVVSGAGKKL
jgi:hypothetical protein